MAHRFMVTRTSVDCAERQAITCTGLVKSVFPYPFEILNSYCKFFRVVMALPARSLMPYEEDVDTPYSISPHECFTSSGLFLICAWSTGTVIRNLPKAAGAPWLRYSVSHVLQCSAQSTLFSFTVSNPTSWILYDVIETFWKNFRFRHAWHRFLLFMQSSIKW
jgi:hypothetical protein